jgi:hypothetical protein
MSQRQVAGSCESRNLTGVAVLLGIMRYRALLLGTLIICAESSALGASGVDAADATTARLG